jgi:hypothetical protein
VPRHRRDPEPPYRSRVSAKAIRHSLYSFEAKFVPVVWAHTPAEGAELVERWAFWFARSIVESARPPLKTPGT